MRIEDELKKLPREFVRVVERIPLRDEKPLPSDWLRCQIVERFRILENLEIKNGENILEVGSGPHAIATIALAHSVGKKGRVVAVDLERWNFFEDTLRNAGVLRRVIPLKCDARNLPFPYEFFDKGVSIHVLRSFKSKEDILKIFREMLRVTRNEIFIATSLPIAKNKAQKAHLEMFKLRCEVLEGAYGEKMEINYLPKKDIEEMVEIAKGKIVESNVIETNLPHHLAYFPKRIIEKIKDEEERKKLGRRWENAWERIQRYGEEHPPALILRIKKS